MLQHQQIDELLDSTDISDSYKKKPLKKNIAKDIDFKIEIPKYHEIFTNFGKKHVLQNLPPETARDISLRVAGLLKPIAFPDSITDIFSQEIGGLNFIHPVGLAAGFDKDGVAGLAMFQSGISAIELGTVTPYPQKGNASPRLFRLKEDKAIINRMGFNNAGLVHMVSRLHKLNNRKKPHQIIGINIGKNKTGEIADYLTCFKQTAHLVDYITINISSPNTPNLRDLQTPDMIQKLVSDCKNHAVQHNITAPIFLKLAPDLELSDIKILAKSLLKLQNILSGLILTNTTIARPELISKHKNQQGGLSGAPLFDISTDILKQFARETEMQIPIIGVGGISNGLQAYQKIKAGASLLQIYTAMIYQSNYLPAHILNDMAEYIKQDGYSHISQAVGAEL
ncbi:MAG: quinone-dependent dihydroorotate dehydrogenase [Alphaproteobacteria bacterium]|nr:quinone-dependent dihydroorotate dehydrogenase [Alphaproteobacteria bacterium]